MSSYSKKPKEIHLKDYTPPDYLVNSIFLNFDLHEEGTNVKTIMDVKLNSKCKSFSPPFVMFGEDLKLKSILLDGKPLDKKNYRIEEDKLIIPKVPTHFKVETEVEIHPEKNTQLSGLYLSQGNFCTQCEAQGFRRITYFPDRPDVMTRFTTTITADKKRYPVLLSNGNLVDEKGLSGNRHWVKWEDPSLKPSYLFALVAGDFDHLEDTFVTMTGKNVLLRVYVEKGKLDQAQFAMDSLKRAMKWDEGTYSREYDLNIYMIVAVSDFNMGAMENKGLNLFNDRYILAKPETATDTDFTNVEEVIGHEYFHNWSGNRVTVSNWFQITLKEGLTIFRDQSFTADLHSAVVKRIEDVNVIRTVQFSQDAGPLAHPIRPESYIEVNNFYTVTVYNKGSEVIRMIETLIGQENFREGMKLYFDRNDGQAVTTEEFIQAMEEAGNIDLKQFRRWYTQAGTPVLHVKSKFNKKKKTYTLEVKQVLPATPGQKKKNDLLIPLAIGLLDQDTGKDLLLPITRILTLKQKISKFKFKNISKLPVPSLLRNFSAPVKLNYPYTEEELLFLMTHDSDGFNRWDAGQELATKIIFKLLRSWRRRKQLVLPTLFINAIRTLLDDKELDKQLLTEMLNLPKIPYLMEQMKVVDIEGLFYVREFIKSELARALQTEFMQRYQENNIAEPYIFSAAEIGQRSIKNICLYYLMQLKTPQSIELCVSQFEKADNMTDCIAALAAINDFKVPERTKLLDSFYQRWKGDDLVVNKWFSLQAISALPDTLSKVKKLISHPAFNYTNPNKVRALIGAFCQYNYINFHNKNGSGYKFLGDQIIKIDKYNAQLGARLLEPLTQWKKFDKARQKLMLEQLQRIKKETKISKDVYEIVSKSLKEK